MHVPDCLAMLQEIDMCILFCFPSVTVAEDHWRRHIPIIPLGPPFRGQDNWYPPELSAIGLHEHSSPTDPPNELFFASTRSL